MDSPGMRHTRLSVIVPVWGDDGMVCELVSGVLAALPDVEWIVAAVEPGPQLHQLAAQGCVHLVPCARPSRGGQMNAGAAVACGEWFCFHHADTALTPAHVRALLDLADPNLFVGGAFHRRFDDRHRWMKKWEKFVHRLDRGYGPFFGDQSIFVRRETFQSLGGFANIPLMEDIEFSRRLKKAGPVKLLHPPIWSSPRRFRRLGNWRSSLLNAFFIALFYAGVSPERLHRWYYREKPSSRNPGTIEKPSQLDPARTE